MKILKSIILALMALLACSTLFANINVSVNLKRPLPPLFSTWRNDPTVIQVILNPTQNYSQVRIAFIVTDLDRDKQVVKTNDLSPAMPRFNLYTGVPLILTGNQLIRDQALDIDPSIRKWSTTTQMLPEGDYEFCVKILDINGNVITTTGVTCRTAIITIPEPPVLISPTGGITLEYTTTILPQFIWSPITNPPPGILINYLLKIAPEFNGQDDRTALENNTPLFNKLLQPGRLSYQYMPSDIPFLRYSDAIAYVWQIQALDGNNIPVTRNEGKSEIGKFLINSNQTLGSSESKITLIKPDNNGNVSTQNPNFSWTSSGKFSSYWLKIAKVPINQDVQSSIDNPNNLLFNKLINDSVYTYSASDPQFQDSSKDYPILGYVWQVSSNATNKLSYNGISTKSEPWLFTRKSASSTTMNNPTSNDINCNVAAPTVNALSTKTYVKNNIVKLGQFQLTFMDDPVNNAGMLSGNAYITIPFLNNINFLVQFTALRINTNDEVVSGSAQAKMTDGFPVVPNTGLNEDQVKQYTDNATKFSQIQALSQVTLPIGIDNVVKSSPFVLAITSCVFAPNGAVIDAALRFTLPGLGDGADLCFGGKVCLNPDGFGDNKELYLTDDFIFPKSGSGWTYTFKHKLSTDKGTYISFDKDGFHELNISANVEFPRTWFVPAPDDNTSKVSFSFLTSYSSTNDLIANCSIPNFSPACFKDIEFDVENMYIDLSSATNPTSIIFPDVYIGDKTNNWQGFYISKAALKLPAMFKSSQGQKLTGEIHNLIIDKSGFTGNASVLGLPDLNLGGFSATIDTFSTQFLNSSFSTGSIAGKLTLPISPDALKYSGTMAISSTGNSNYSFNVTTDSPNGLSVPMWVAKFNLLPTSSINITSSASGFKAEALLNASITIDSKIGPLPIKFEAMKVENLKITPDGLQGGSFSFGSPQKSLCGFDLSATDIKLVSSGTNKFGLAFDIKSLELFGSEFTGSTKFTIWGKKSGLSFAYDSYQLDKISVKGDLICGLINLNGELDIYNGDTKFGDGFRGNISAKIMKEIKGDITVQFGSKLKSGSTTDRFQYWYVDASIVSDAGFPVGPGVGIYGIGGGAYYNMKPLSSPSSVPSSSKTAGTSTLGATSSGAKYEPSEQTTMGFKAMVLFGIYPTAYPLNGSLSLDITFQQINNNWSVNKLTLTGKAFLCANVTNQGSNLANGTAMIKMDFANKRFEGDFSLNINFIDLITGTASLDILADSKLNKWHVYVGDWEHEVGLSIAGLFSVETYFMVGNDLPGGLPPFPSDVQQIFQQCGKTLPSVSLSDRSKISQGQGISFGASSKFGGDYSFLIFYANLHAGLGFDLNLHDYQGATCKNSSSSLGIDGWYALGQMYAYIDASVGIHIDVWFAEGDFEIFSGGFAAILQGGLPNPIWGKGAVAGYYRVLDGLISGHCSFEFDFGNQCELEMENPLAIGLISDMQPTGNDVSPFISPVATFNFPIPDGNKDNSFEIQMTGSDGNPGPIRTFRIILDEKSITENNGTEIKFDEGVTDKGMTLALTPKSVVDSKKCKFKIRAHGEELIHNTWQVCRYEKDPNKGKEIKSDTTVSFTTGKEPPYVPDKNEMYSFPARGQRYFIPDKSILKKGYIALRQEQSDLFNPDKFLDKFSEYKNHKSDLEVDYLALFKYDGNKEKEVPAIYQPVPPRVEFDITHLTTSKVYNVQIIARIKPKSDISKTKLTVLQQKIVKRNSNVIDTTKSKKIDIEAMKTLQPNEKSLFQDDLFFRTSKFSSLNEKINSYSFKSVVLSPINCTINLNLQEPFDNVDIKGVAYKDDESRDVVFGPFVKFEENENTDWLNMAKFGVYDVYNGNTHVSFADGTQARNPLPYWLNMEATGGNCNCTDGDHEWDGISNEIDPFNKHTARDNSIKENIMINTHFSGPFNSLSNAVAFKTNETSTYVYYVAPVDYSTDLFLLLQRITFEANFFQDFVKFKGQKAMDYECLYGNCLALAGGSQNDAINLYFHYLNVNQNYAGITYNVLWFLLDDITKNYLPADKQKLFGNISFFIKGWYPPAPGQYNPESHAGWIDKGINTISFDAH
ncbi:MAG: hypothetical protein ABSG15_03995 [FCB group bacterium]